MNIEKLYSMVNPNDVFIEAESRFAKVDTSYLSTDEAALVMLARSYLQRYQYEDGLMEGLMEAIADALPEETDPVDARLTAFRAVSDNAMAHAKADIEYMGDRFRERALEDFPSVARYATDVQALCGVYPGTDTFREALAARAVTNDASRQSSRLGGQRPNIHR